MNLKSKLVLASLLSVMLFTGCGFDTKKDAIIMIMIHRLPNNSIKKNLINSRVVLCLSRWVLTLRQILTDILI